MYHPVSSENDAAGATRHRFVALGDSITWGFPEGTHASWVALAARASGVEIINMGVNGDTLAGMRARLGRVLAARPVACIVTGGTNDAALGRPVPDMAADLGAMVEALANAGVVPVIGMPPPFLDARCERILAGYRQFVNTLAGTRHVRVVPFDRAFRSADGTVGAGLLADVAHPAPAGYEAMAEMLLRTGILQRGGNGG
ncbi:MAG: GDSL family lipase [Nitrospirae bacterium]|nr:GDSL family lipase [Nitrospirota bacterium]